MAIDETNQIIEIPEEKTYLKAEIKEIWTPHMIIAKNVSDITYYKEPIRIVVNGKRGSTKGFAWGEYVERPLSCDLDHAFGA